MSQSGSFSDLRTRLISAIVLLIIGGCCLWFGGLPLKLLLVVAAGLMIWEVMRMYAVAPIEQYLLAAAGAVAVGLGFWDQPIAATALMITTALFGAFRAQSNRILVFLAMLAVTLGVLAFGSVRLDVGLVWAFWLVFCVIASDVGGYFAGRIFGGPKLWPAVSPKKTWSGTIGGWVLAALVSVAFLMSGFGSGLLVVEGVLIAAFAQAGDLAESVLKRKAGIKDSSNLIPGHGGLLDRFDGLLGASLFAGALILFGFRDIFEAGL